MNQQLGKSDLDATRAGWSARSQRDFRLASLVPVDRTGIVMQSQPGGQDYPYPHFDGHAVAHHGDRIGCRFDAGQFCNRPGRTPFGTAVAEMEVSMWASAKLHGRRFGVRHATSLIRLMSVDRRVTHRDGGVAIITYAGHRVWWTLVFVSPYVSGLCAVVAAPTLSGKAIGLLIGCLTGLLLGPRFARQLHAGASFDVGDRPWMLTDVATVTGRQVGDRMLGAVTLLADRYAARLVLSVRPDNTPAVNLYHRHGFLSIGSRRGLMLMQRVPKPSVKASPSGDSRAFGAGYPVLARAFEHSELTAALCATTVGALLFVYRSEPQIWLMPGVAAVAVYAATIDLATRRIPNVLMASGAMVSIAVLAVLSGRNDVSFRRALLGMIVMAIPLLVSHLVTRSRTPGLGDVKLAGVLGLALGAVHPVLAYFALTSALVLGAVLGGLHRWLTGQRTFPFAPAISVGVVGVLLVAGAVGVDRQWLL
jgi:leader peptidase (prepilin peptidase) / N-methyltransferase